MEDITRERAQFLRQAFCNGFVEFCGFAVEKIGKGYWESTLCVDERHRQQDGFVHAGVISTMADHTAGYAAFTIVPEEFQIVTVEFKINFLHPTQGEKLLCRSLVIKEGLQVIVAESEIHDLRRSGEKLSSKATVTLSAVHGDRIRQKRS